MDTYRTQVKGWVSDQGTEKAVPGFPFGSLDNVTRRLRKAATLQGLVASSKEAFLWNFQHPGMLHVVFNALEKTCKACPRWNQFKKKQLSDVSKLLTNRSFREVVTGRMMAHAAAMEKKTVQNYHRKLLFWRWESLHDTLQHYVSLREILVKYWDRKCLSFEAALCDAVTSALFGAVSARVCRMDIHVLGLCAEVGSLVGRLLLSRNPSFRKLGRAKHAPTNSPDTAHV